jgi:hypothetical protein
LPNELRFFIPSPIANLEMYELGSVGNLYSISVVCPQLFVVYLVKIQNNITLVMLETLITLSAAIKLEQIAQISRPVKK